MLSVLEELGWFLGAQLTVIPMQFSNLSVTQVALNIWVSFTDHFLGWCKSMAELIY